MVSRQGILSRLAPSGLHATLLSNHPMQQTLRVRWGTIHEKAEEGRTFTVSFEESNARLT